jgi:hypothetical protein
MLPNIHSHPNMQHETYDPDVQDQMDVNLQKNYHTAEEDDYDSDYMGPRKPYMREDRSTSPPDHDPMFRRNHQRSVGIQEVGSVELLPKMQKKRNSSKKKHTPQKIKFSQNFIKKYPSLFKGVKGKHTKRKHGKVLTVMYKPWIPSTRKFNYFDEIAHKYKVY